jgi:flagellar biosynthesis protein FlhA
LSRQIIQLYKDDNDKITCLTVDPNIEQIISESIQPGDHGSYLAIDPRTAQAIIKETANIIGKKGIGKQLVLLVSPAIRIYLRKLIERSLPGLPILSYNEVPTNVEIESVGMVRINAG